VYEAGAQVRGGPVPIGRPVANTQLYVLDGQQELVPEGVAGELYIGGAQLARGYLNRPDLTAEKFVPNPFGAAPGARLYRTGDLVRYLPQSDGILEFLGRNDDQVKIRGFRLELGEVEAVLRQHPAIHEAVATALEEMPADRRLVAYLVTKPGSTLDANNLHQFLSTKLPWYMIPSDFLALERLPLTANGKIDRRALPAPDQLRPILKAAYVAPQTPTEQILAGIWSEILNREQIGVHDSFFALGGDSIMSVRVVALARERGLDFSVRQLFEYQTISKLARKLEAMIGLPDTTETDADGQDDQAALAQLLEEIEDLSADDVRRQLREKSAIRY
jgi:aryl carrier-like protein